MPRRLVREVRSFLPLVDGSTAISCLVVNIGLHGESVCRMAPDRTLLQLVGGFPERYCASDGASDRSPDRSIVPLLDGFPDVSRAVLLDRWLGRSHDGSHAGSLGLLPLIDGFPDGLRTVSLVGWHVDSFVGSIIF